MNIHDCMKMNVFSVPDTATVREAISLLVSKHIGLLPVVDRHNRPVGVVGLRDFLKFALPSSFSLQDDLDFLGDFGALEHYRPTDNILAKPVTDFMRPATIVHEDSGLLRAYTFMLLHDLHDLPVVDEKGQLSGIASRVDIGVTILADWV